VIYAHELWAARHLAERDNALMIRTALGLVERVEQDVTTEPMAWPQAAGVTEKGIPSSAHRQRTDDMLLHPIASRGASVEGGEAAKDTQELPRKLLPTRAKEPQRRRREKR
jgi:hypothetical protein